MKVKIIAGVVVLLFVSIFVGNWIVGNKVAEEIDAELRDKISKMDLPLLLTYSDIGVNPLLSKVNIKTISISDDRRTGKLNCDDIAIKISYGDALELIKSNKLENIKSFQITLKTPSFQEFSTNSEISFDDITFDFDGHITKKMIMEIEQDFPKEKQHLELSFSNLKFDFPEIFRELMLTSDLQNQISKVDNANISLSYLPDSKELLIENLSISTPIISLQYFGRIKYNGNNPTNYRPSQFDIETNISITPSNLEWGDPGETGRFSFSKISTSGKTSLKLTNGGFLEEQIPQGEFSFLIEGLSAEFSGRLKRSLEIEDLGQILGVSFDEIEIEKFAISMKMENSRFTISNAELVTPLGNATLTADLLFDERNPENSIINNGKLVISNLSSDLELTVTKFEKEMRQSLPRIDKDIVLEFSGILGNPKVKGLNL